MLDLPLLLPLLLVFLFPLAIYCWVLAGVNRHSEPTLLRGTWDCLGMLFAASGMILVVGPTILTVLFVRLLQAVRVDENVPETAEIFMDLVLSWWFFWAFYYTLVLAGGALLLWLRRNKTEIYNVDVAMFAQVLNDTLESLGLGQARSQQRLHIAPVGMALAGSSQRSEAVTAGAPPRPVLASGAPAFTGPAFAELEIEVFPALCHATLHWRHHGGNLRHVVETELAKRLDGARAEDNPAGSWLLGVSGLLFGLLILTAMVLILTKFFPPRRW